MSAHSYREMAVLFVRGEHLRTATGTCLFQEQHFRTPSVGQASKQNVHSRHHRVWAGCAPPARPPIFAYSYRDRVGREINPRVYGYTDSDALRRSRRTHPLKVRPASSYKDPIGQGRKLRTVTRIRLRAPLQRNQPGLSCHSVRSRQN